MCRAGHAQRKTVRARLMARKFFLSLRQRKVAEVDSRTRVRRCNFRELYGRVSRFTRYTRIPSYAKIPINNLMAARARAIYNLTSQTISVLSRWLQLPCISFNEMPPLSLGRSNRPR